MNSSNQKVNGIFCFTGKWARFVSILIAASILGFSACEVEQEVIFVVEAPLQPYFDRFINEAGNRGIDVAYATSQVEARVGEITQPNVIGQCSWDQTHQHSIVVDQDYWRGANDLQREFLIFHELGHCVLGRDHVDNSDAQGNCVSMMSSGTGNCRVLYTNTNRKKLLDELFTY